MESIETVCELCGGTRYNEEVLQYRYHGKNIAEVMDMTVNEACEFFRLPDEENPQSREGEEAEKLQPSADGEKAERQQQSAGKENREKIQSSAEKDNAEKENAEMLQPWEREIRRGMIPPLTSLQKVGLGYLHLNQAMTTLSGGELQRVKLASELKRKGTIFIIDEPTSGLHLDDIRKLMELFQQMTDAGNSIFLVEHSLDVMKEADYVIEVGPGGGEGGGNILFAGTPEEMLRCEPPVTRPYLEDAI